MKASCIVFRIKEFNSIKEVVLMAAPREICEALVSQVHKEAQIIKDNYEDRKPPTFDFISSKSNGFKKILETHTFYDWSFSCSLLLGIDNKCEHFSPDNEMEIRIKDLVCYDENTLPNKIKKLIGVTNV